jgi:hypothetical protein
MITGVEGRRFIVHHTTCSSIGQRNRLNQPSQSTTVGVVIGVLHMVVTSIKSKPSYQLSLLQATRNTTAALAIVMFFRTLPTFMQRQILAFLGYQHYTLAGRTCQYLHARWTEAVDTNNQLPLLVPVDCTTFKRWKG